MTTKSTEKKCVARRHMTPLEFCAYDAMLATAKSGQEKREAEGKPRGELIFSGKITTLANKMNVSKDAATKAVKGLVAARWIITRQAKGDAKEQRRNQRAGTWATYEYQVVEHDEYANTNNCPPERYDSRGNLIEPRKATPVSLQRYNLRRLLGKDWAEEHGGIADLTDGVVAAILNGGFRCGLLSPAERLCAVCCDAVTEHSVPVAATESSVTAAVTVEQPLRELPSRTATEDSVTTVTDTSVTTVTEDSVTRSASLSAMKVGLPSCLPSGGRTAELSSNSFNQEQEEEMESEVKTAMEKEWQRFLAMARKLEAYRAAYMTTDEEKAVRAQVGLRRAEVVAEALRNWTDERTPPIDERKYGRWSCWLKEGGEFLRKSIEDHREKANQRQWECNKRELRTMVNSIRTASAQGRIFLKSNWSFSSDPDLIKMLSDKYPTDTRQRSKLVEQFYDLQLRIKAWEVLFNGASVPDDYTADDWQEEVASLRADIQQRKDHVSGK